ncbi:MAG: hypothetical protein GEU73_01985 [Chloroflexi bacterium]|nr:hypothetical protein [Chloroflexota bacterium]
MNFKQAASNAAIEALVNCWLRETGLVGQIDASARGGAVRLSLPRLGLEIGAELASWSRTGRHRWGRVTFGRGVPADPVSLAALLAREAAVAEADDGVAAFVVRVADSTARIADFLEARAWQSGTSTATAFLDAEQSLLLGHPFHPTPKSREGLTAVEARRYSPELRGAFPLHWFRADRRVISEDSAVDRPASELLARLAGFERGEAGRRARPRASLAGATPPCSAVCPGTLKEWVAGRSR